MSAIDLANEIREEAVEFFQNCFVQVIPLNSSFLRISIEKNNFCIYEEFMIHQIPESRKELFTQMAINLGRVYFYFTKL